jgi:hypothetical protein
MKYLLFFILSIFISIASFATTYTTTGDGNWNDGSNWDANGSPGTYWGSGDIVIINNLMTLNVNIGFAGSLTLNSGSSLIGNRNISLNNGASIIADGEISIKQLTLNSTSTMIHSEPLTTSGNVTIGTSSSLTSNAPVVFGGNLSNNGGVIVANNTYDISGNLTNNNGTITFNQATTVGGKFDNNNSSAVINLNSSFDVSGNITNNSSATINIDTDAIVSTSGNFTNNSSSQVNNDGRINASGNFKNNGGDIDSNGIVDIGGSFTQNSGSFTNNGGMIVDGSFTINGSGTVNGDGVLRVDQITNHGTFTGSVDICRQDDSTPTSTSGGGTYNVNLTYCSESSSAALPVTLIGFKAKFIENDALKICWKTASELNNESFTVYYSFDGIEFIKAKIIDGAGNSNKELKYKTVIQDVKENLVYLKLVQKDFDGKIENFPPIVVKKDATQENLSENISLYPNPGEGHDLYVDLKNFKAKVYEILLFDYKGTIIENQTIDLSETNSFLNFNLLKNKKLAQGIYYVRVRSEDFLETKKHIVY